MIVAHNPMKPSFRGDAKHRTRNLEIPGLVLPDHPGMTNITCTMAKSKKAVFVDVARLTKAQAKVEHMRLALEIEAHNERYYQKDAPTVSDAAYDALRHRLEAIEAKFPDLVTGDSPTQKVGA